MKRSILISLLIPLLAPAAYPIDGEKVPVCRVSSNNEIIIDLSGKKLPESPNPTVPRWGLTPGITKVNRPVLLLRKTANSVSRGTILLFPGGGYSALAIMHEGKMVADFLNMKGFDTAILEYSIGKTPSIRSRALKDARKAWNLLKARGEKLGMASPAGVMGFSAGGHLAARLVHTLGAVDGPGMVMLIYPAYLEEHAGSLGVDPSVAPPKNSKARFFVLIGDKDKPNWINGASSYAVACRDNGQPVEFHLLRDTGHGFGMKPDRTGSASNWECLLGEFLKH